jgi:hypothetical protein
MTISVKHLTQVTAALALALLLAVLTAACSGHGSAGAEASSGKAAGASALASATANPTVAAELTQAKALVKTCFAGTPTQQIHQVHVVFLSSATGKNGAQVQAARTTTFGCLGIPPDQRQNFINDALTAAEHASPKLTTHDGRVNYFEVTLPRLVLKYKAAASGAPSSGAAVIPGTSTTPAPTFTPTVTLSPTATVTP